MSNCIILKSNFDDLAVMRLNSDEFKPGGMHEKHAVVTWEPSQHLLKDRRETRKACLKLLSHV
jgi:hypothetical protein